MARSGARCGDCNSTDPGNEDEGDGKCSHCNGTGKADPDLFDAVVSAVTGFGEDFASGLLGGDAEDEEEEDDEEDCVFCEGSGVCQTCDGTGVVDWDNDAATGDRPEEDDDDE